MANRNKYGLKRSALDAATKRAVRQRCGFGCVICGVSIYDYEHFAPEFKEARAHVAAGITLLCPNHHRLKTNGLIDLAAVAEADRAPRSKAQGFSNGSYGFGAEPIQVAIGGATFIDVVHLIQVAGYSVLSIASPEEAGGPFRLSGLFTNELGQIVLSIKDNEFKVAADNFDVEATGNRLVIRQDIGKVSLTLVCSPPQNLVVERIAMQFLGARIEGDADEVVVTSRDGRARFKFQGCTFQNDHAGIVV